MVFPLLATRAGPVVRRVNVPLQLRLLLLLLPLLLLLLLLLLGGGVKTHPREFVTP